MNHPKKPLYLFCALIALIGGIMMQTTYAFQFETLALLFVGYALSITIGAYWYTRTQGRRSTHTITHALYGLYVLTGALAVQHQTTSLAELNAFFCKQPLTVEGTIINKYSHDLTAGKWNQLTTLDVEIYSAAPQPLPVASTRIQCFVKQTVALEVGDAIAIKDIQAKKPPQPPASGNPSFHLYLQKEGYTASYFIKHNQITLLNHPQKSIRRWLWNQRQTMFTSIIKQLNPMTAHFFATIFLGKKEPTSSQELRPLFSYWGLAHYLARSGLHIVLFISLWSFFLGLIPLHRRIKIICLLACCIIYSALSWASTPFYRAFFTFIALQLGSLLDYTTSFFHILSLICILFLLFNPLHLFFIDFQLTFGLTFALSWIAIVSTRPAEGEAAS